MYVGGVLSLNKIEICKFNPLKKNIFLIIDLLENRDVIFKNVILIIFIRALFYNDP